MRVHHLNCGTMRPPGGLVGELVCHCLLIETENGLVLVDTGLGAQAIEHPKQWLGGGFLLGTGARLDPAETALQQIGRLGYDPADVRHVIVTHLDLDHAGGLRDFPQAKVHLHESEYTVAMRPPTFPERQRYRQVQWEHGPDWATYSELDGEDWFGFEAVRRLDGLPEDILLIPLPGHTRGHSGVAVRSGDGWLLHAGDAYFHRAEVDPSAGRPPRTLRAFESMVQVLGKDRHANQARLRKLAATAQVKIFCAHDPVELPR